ncbi:hypothetical protein [Cyclobacterium plantarum]|uniref:Uncharacterized protein n=1 Tax=Cyclobacterium plantarum TaxID=2716263 RepID=A0ABX0HAF8_9BACT|nr:hypothetical protein [Cyclobacterium plantarum]NHE58632.1 hypothetical protein [Cyclobacterium plantarum]
MKQADKKLLLLVIKEIFSIIKPSMKVLIYQGYSPDHCWITLIRSGIYLSWATYKKPTAQTAHLVFADTKANAEKPKELFFANARTENETEKVNLETE